MIVSAALREATARLAATSDTARLDAEVLMAHALGVTRSDLLVRHMDQPEPAAFAALVERRALHEPVAYIVGSQEFYGLELYVDSNVLIPRADSETIITAAIEALVDAPPKRILDLGTGSGALLLAALSIWPAAEGIGIDSSINALMVAIRNAELHANVAVGLIGDANPAPPQPPMRGLARLVQRDWHQPGWAEHLGTFDLILANPPYVEDAAPLDPDVARFEPAGALFAGPDGLDDYRVLIPQLPALLAPGGVAVLEIGHTQAPAVAEIAAAAGFLAEVRPDLAGRPRAVLLRRSGD